MAPPSPGNRPEPGLYEASRGNTYCLLVIVSCSQEIDDGITGVFLDTAHHVGPPHVNVPANLDIRMIGDRHCYVSDRYDGEIAVFHPVGYEHRLMFMTLEDFVGNDDCGTPRFTKVG